VYSRKYYERTNSLLQQYIYIDRLLDSSLPHSLLNEYSDTPSSRTATNHENVDGPAPILEASSSKPSATKVKRTPRELYRVHTEESLLLAHEEDDGYNGPRPEIPRMEDDSVESGDRIVQIAIYINLAANAALLAGKIAVIALTSSLSVLASLVDAALDFLSTAIV
jgi:hypothetical protein